MRLALRAVGLLLGIVTLVFLGVRAAPGDPVDHLLGETATESERADLRRQLHLDGPLWAQYAGMLGEIADGTLGTSRAVAGQPVPASSLIAQRLPSTLALALASVVAAIAFALPLGIVGARWRGRWPDHLARLWSLLAVSLPAFVFGPLAIFLFAVALRWAPTPAHPAHPAAALVLPAVVIGFALSGRLARLLRSSLIEALTSDMAQAWRARGASARRVLWRHALPNALLPVVTLLGLQLAALLGGALVTEKIFGRKGLGTLLLDGIAARDHAVVQGCVLAIAALYIVAMGASSAVAAWVDPRLRRPAGDL
ncbi:MAG: ABC transporter permease [Deltaproteobacteria bacterium]|nr:ABC transporter permease [Deltaproteobacteria bacterium]